MTLDADNRGQTWIDAQRILNGLHDRFVQFPMRLQLGNLASELARVRAWTESLNQSVTRQIEICRGLIEWIAPALLPDRVEEAAALVDIQRGLTHWCWNWNQVQHDPAQRANLAEQAQAWSDEVLKMSGLLNEE